MARRPATSLPLPRGFFGIEPEAIEKHRAPLLQIAETSLKQVFELCATDTNRWAPVREKKQCTIFRNFQKKNTPIVPERGSLAAGQGPAQNTIGTSTEISCKATVGASIPEVARIYTSHDDQLFKKVMKKVHRKVLDSANLYNLVTRTPMNPYRYIGVKWFAVKSSGPLLSDRDYCCLEVQDVLQDASGTEMFIRILVSVDLPECPSLEKSLGLVRAKTLSGFMYRRDRTSDDNTLYIHHVARTNFGGNYPGHWALRSAESELWHSVVQIRKIIEKQQTSSCKLIDKRLWVPNSQREHCAVCSRGFGTFRHRHHCRSCGEVICTKCSVFRPIDVPGTNIKNIRVCTLCNVGIKQRSTHAEDDMSDTMSEASCSSVTSTSTNAFNEMNMADLYLSSNPNTPSAQSTCSNDSMLSFRSDASFCEPRASRISKFNSSNNHDKDCPPSPDFDYNSAQYYRKEQVKRKPLDLAYLSPYTPRSRKAKMKAAEERATSTATTRHTISGLRTA